MRASSLHDWDRGLAVRRGAGGIERRLGYVRISRASNRFTIGGDDG